MDEGDSTHTNRLHALDRYPPLKVVEAKKVIDEISEGSNSEINSDNSNTRSKDDMYKELLGNNKDNKSITTSQAIDLIRNILNTAESKRGSTPPISPSNGNNDDSEKDNNFGDLDSDRDCRSTKVCLAENKNDSEVAKYDHKIEGRSAKATAKDAKFQDDSDILYDDNIIIKDVKDSSVNGVNVNSLTIDTKNNASEKIESSLFNKSDRPDIAPPASIETASGITCNLKDHRCVMYCYLFVYRY